MTTSGCPITIVLLVLITPAIENINVMPDPVSGTGQARSGIQPCSGFPRLSQTQIRNSRK
jgi:hypothetical protein